MHPPQPLCRISNGLRKKHALLASQFKILRRCLLVAVVEPRCQPLRGGEQINVACDETRIGVIVRLLNLGVPDLAVRLARPSVVASEVSHVKNVHGCGRRCTAARAAPKISCDDRGQPVRNCFIQKNSFRQSNVHIDFLRIARGRCGPAGLAE